MAKRKVKRKKRKLNIKRFLIFLTILILFGILIYFILNIKIRNIYIKGNNILSDQEIIDISKISNYPKSIDNMSFEIEKRLEKNDLILNADVHKNLLLSKVYITVKENYPLFYYKIDNNTVLYNGKTVKEKYTVPTIINQVPDTIYKKFYTEIKKVDKDILNRISEIEYKPNDVDKERFLFIMNDENYVYVTVRKIYKVNRYIDMLKVFDGKKGILYLDSGEYFEVFK